jgi:hypothetical protein
MSVPYIFGNDVGNIQLGQLDTNFATPVTLGSTPVALGNTVTTVTGLNTTGNAANVTGTVAVANGGTGLTTTPANGALDIGNGTGFTRATLTAGTGVTITNASGSITIAANGTGVTSVTGTSPVVSSGGTTPAISLATAYGDTLNPYASKTANYVLAAPNGTAGVPTFRAIIAADIPTLNQNTTGTASNVTGTVAIANGGTNSTTAANALTALGAQPLFTVQTANTVYSGPSTGSPATPTFRALTTADISGYAGGVTQIIAGTNVSISPSGGTGAVTVNASSSGTVASVGLALPASVFSVSGSPVTTTGTLTGTLVTQSINTLFAGPASGSAAAPTFRSLTTADIPTLNQNTTGNAATATNPASGGSFITSSNIGSQSVSYASSAGSASTATTATTATTAGTCTGNAATATNPASGGSFITSSNIGSQSVSYASSAGSASTATTATTANALNSSNTYSVTKLTATPNTSGVSTGITCANGDMTAYRSGGTTGVIYLSSSGSNYLYWDATNYNLNGGNLVVTGNVTAYSDERLKTNWRGYASDFIEQLAKVKSGTYDRVDYELTQDGVSGQGLQKVLPNSIITAKDGTLSVNYGGAALVSAVELAKRIVEQDERIAKLEEALAKSPGWILINNSQ